MKTLLATTFIAALVAFVVLPVNFVAALSVLFATGLAAILVSDYRRARPLTVRATPVAAVMRQRTERFGLAA